MPFGGVDDEEYPPLLKKIYSPPYVLYLKGEHLNWDKLLTITIVGTRIHSDYGKYVTETITKQLVKYDVTIVSGMAKGIDAIAGTTAINCSGKTIAVLGSGIDIIYPYENRKLCEQIINNGVISVNTNNLNKSTENKHGIIAIDNRTITAVCGVIGIKTENIKFNF